MVKKIYLSSLFLLALCNFTTSLAVPEEQAPAQFSSDEVNFRFFVQTDAVSFMGDTIDIVRNRTNFKDGPNIPRARFFVFGKKWDWFYIFSYDAAEERIRNAFLRYEEYPHFHILIGQYQIPYSFSGSKSRDQFNFLENGLPPLAFNPGFRTALQGRLLLDPITFTYGVVGPQINNTLQGMNVKGRVPLAYSGRLTFVPIHKDLKVVQFGMSNIFQKPDSLQQFRFRAYPEVQTYNNHFLVNTGVMPQCDNFWGQEYETFIQYKSFYCDTEFYKVHVNRQIQDVDFHGYFATVDYFLTGEHYVYNFENGTVEGLRKILHDYGAWELTMRYSNVDLLDADIEGGREANIALGINWYPNMNLKFMLDFINVNAYPSENGLGRHMNIIALRCQIGAVSEKLEL